MRVPHTIPVNALMVYAASEQSLTLKAERYRTIRSEDLTWDEVVPTSLAHICIKSLADNFIEHCHVTSYLQYQSFDYLLEILAVDLPLKVVAPILKESVYWKRRCQSRWPNQPLDINKHSKSWKQMYIERHCTEYIQMQEPGYIDWDDVNELMKICSPFVIRLVIRELKPPRQWGPTPNLPDTCVRGKTDPDHMDLSPVLENLMNLTELSVRYSVLNCGMNYKPELFLISTADVINLGIGLTRIRYLKTFRLHRCALDDSKISYIIEALQFCGTIESLEISHCLFGDIGAKALAKLLTLHKGLMSLSIQNNKIKKDGAHGIAYALIQENCCHIMHLNLEFNDLGDAGVCRIASALMKNKTLRELFLGSVGMTSRGAIKLGQSLLFCNSIHKIRLTNNRMNVEAGEALLHAVQNNTHIHTLDIRNCSLGEEIETAIFKLLMRNRANFRII